MKRSLLRLDLPQAVGLAVLIHLILFLGGEVRPDLLPWAALGEEPPEPPPLRFEFVDVDREPPEPETPPEEAPASDRTRRAATPERPPDVPESRDPYAEGNTAARVVRPGTPEPAPPAEPEPRAEPGETAGRPPETVPEAPGERKAPETGRDRAEEERKAQAILDAARPFSLRELGQRYDNVGAPVNADFGTVSFDTVGVDWGPYAKVIVEIIRRNWIDRMPPAFEAGLKGRSVLSFRIAKDGTVSGIVLEDGSGVRPYDKAAEYAIEASDPLPPLPPAFGALDKEDVGVTFEFYYNLRPPTR